MPYNYSMARPTKKNNEFKFKLADFIRSGLTVKDTCESTGISTSTFNRWRNSDAEFDKLISEATRSGWENAEAYMKYHYRGYKKKGKDKASFPDELKTRSAEGLKRQFETLSRIRDKKGQNSLPIRFTYPTSYPSDFYINGNNGMVERFTKKGILQSMRMDIFEKKYLDKDDNYGGMMII